MPHTATRIAPVDAPVLDVVGARWSTRIFDRATAIDEGALASALEAARWAPSASNTQPTRFIVARRGSDAHAVVAAALSRGNVGWAVDAGALVVVVAETATADGERRRWAEFDAGQASAYFSLQAHADGLMVHPMGGFDPAAIAAGFALPERLVPIAVLAVGALGDPDDADPAMLAREQGPRVRRPVAESVLVDD